VPNENKSADNHPDWVAPANPNAPEGKKWTIGVQRLVRLGTVLPDGTQRMIAGNLTGAIKIKLTPNNPSAASASSWK
jgi:hypothetical protein